MGDTLETKLNAANSTPAKSDAVKPEQVAATATAKADKAALEFAKIFTALQAGKRFDLYTIVPENKLAGNHTVEKDVLHRGLDSFGHPQVLVRLRGASEE